MHLKLQLVQSVNKQENQSFFFGAHTFLIAHFYLIIAKNRNDSKQLLFQYLDRSKTFASEMNGHFKTDNTFQLKLSSGFSLFRFHLLPFAWVSLSICFSSSLPFYLWIVLAVWPFCRFCESVLFSTFFAFIIWIAFRQMFANMRAFVELKMSDAFQNEQTVCAI